MFSGWGRLQGCAAGEFGGFIYVCAAGEATKHNRSPYATLRLGTLNIPC